MLYTFIDWGNRSFPWCVAVIALLVVALILPVHLSLPAGIYIATILVFIISGLADLIGDARKRQKRFCDLTIPAGGGEMNLVNKAMWPHPGSEAWTARIYWVRELCELMRYPAGRVCLQALFDLRLAALAKKFNDTDDAQTSFRKRLESTLKSPKEHWTMNVEGVENLLDREEKEHAAALDRAKEAMNFARTAVGKLGFRTWRNYRAYLLLNEDEVLKEALYKIFEAKKG
ncbi:MAG: hypothetical protein V1696_00455 [Candidatus Jorgensenbacteria bacterium]